MDLLNALIGFVGALIGAAVGAIATIVTARYVLRSERNDRREQEVAARRLAVTDALTRSLADLQQVVINPSSNVGRFSAVESAALAALTAFIAQLNLPAEVGVSEFALRVHHAVRYSMAVESVWGDVRVLREQALLPLQRWAQDDGSFSAEWFRKRVSMPESAFKSTVVDIAPESFRPRQGQGG